MMKIKLTISILCALLITGNVFTQDAPDWVWKTPMSKVYPTGEYYNLPQAQEQVNYQNPNTETRYVKNGNEVLVLPPNVRPFPHTATQSEVDATNMTGNGSIVFASWNSYGPSFYGTGFAYSNNGGTTWTGNFQMYTPNSGDPGAIVWPAGSTWAGRLGLSSIQGFGHSTNEGANWVFDQNFPGASSFDKNFSAVDDVTGSPYFGRAYTIWTNFGGTYTNYIVGSYSTNGGVTWSTAAPVSQAPASGHHQQGCDIRVGPGGVVYAVWAHCTTNGQNSTEDHLGFAKSTDGGVTWSAQTNTAVDVNGIRNANLFNGIRASGFPRLAIDRSGGARNGWIYAVLAEKTGGPLTLDVSDVTICISSNGGTSWTHSKVNQDPSNGRYNYMPAVCVTPDGGVNVTYYDQRNTTGFVTEFWMSRSLNGGTTWTDVAVSDHTFTPAPISGLAGGYQGDYTGCTYSSGSGKIFPFWADNSSGTYQVWTSGITYGPPPANDVVVGPFLSLPGQFVAGSPYSIKGKVTNGGTNAQSNLPIRFTVNGGAPTTNTITNLPSGATDSSAFNWTPSTSGSYTLKIFSGAAVDENRANDTISTTVTVLPAGTVVAGTTICRNGLNILIPQTGSAPRDSIVVNIPNTFGVVDVNVRLDTIVHTYDGDLSIALTHLAGSSTLAGQVGAGGDNFINTILNDSATTPIGSGVAPFTGSFQPSSPLSAFNGLAVNGSWKLAIDDLASGDSGILKAWCLVLRYQTIVGGIQTIEIPNYYSLAQNYPNPFNPTTSIKFSVPTPEMVTLKIFDVLGREVAVLVNEMKQPGFHTVDFDASSFASGIYFYRIDAGQFTSVKRMVLVK
ncbi:MAG: T9SS type A sorting domain-containing protein [Ignavibacteria bacterium]|nr:T9SS type A sorting domain-containing protein [Ignavibacteria bacterium]